MLKKNKTKTQKPNKKSTNQPNQYTKTQKTPKPKQLTTTAPHPQPKISGLLLPNYINAKETIHIVVGCPEQLFSTLAEENYGK